jgi:hypothetical protein
VQNPLVPGLRAAEPIAASADETIILSTDLQEVPMSKELLAAIATAAGVKPEDVTEANALDMVGKVQGRIATLESDKSNLTKQLSADAPAAPSKTELSLSARLLESQVESAFGKHLSPAGLAEAKALIVGNRDKAEYSTFMLSQDSPEDAVSLVEKLGAILAKNPPVTTGGKTTQQTVALGRETPDDPGDKDTLADRVTKEAAARAAREAKAFDGFAK